jgi:hypothetical protein
VTGEPPEDDAGRDTMNGAASSMTEAITAQLKTVIDIT